MFFPFEETKYNNSNSTAGLTQLNQANVSHLIEFILEGHDWSYYLNCNYVQRILTMSPYSWLEDRCNNRLLSPSLEV